MNRRKFIASAAAGMGAAYLAPSALANGKVEAHDTVTLGKTGIRTSRLAMGTGTVGFGGSSNQTRRGGLTRLLRTGFDRGLIFFDTADSYGSHPEVAQAVSQLPRDRVVIMTKCDERDPKKAKADIDRYRRELKTDYIAHPAHPLRDRGRLDRTIPRRNGRLRRSQAEENHPHARGLLPQY